MAKQEPRSAVAQVRLVRRSERLTPKERTRRRMANSAAAAGTSAVLTGVPAVALGVKGPALGGLVGTAAAGGAALGTLKPVPRTRRTYAFEASKRDAFGIEKYHPQPVQQAMGRGQKAKEAVDTTKSTVRRVRRMAGGFSNPRIQGLPQGEVTNRYSRAFL